jgi:hypothetical protein
LCGRLCLAGEHDLAGERAGVERRLCTRKGGIFFAFDRDQEAAGQGLAVEGREPSSWGQGR